MITANRLGAERLHPNVCEQKVMNGTVLFNFSRSWKNLPSMLVFIL